MLPCLQSTRKCLDVMVYGQDSPRRIPLAVAVSIAATVAKLITILMKYSMSSIGPKMTISINISELARFSGFNLMS